MNHPLPRVAVIGLGKLGSPMAAVFASRGFSVIGADLDPAKVAAINEGRSPVNETSLAEYIAKHKANLSATTDIEDAVRKSDLIFIIVPTPSDADGGFSLKYTAPACERIGKALATMKNRPVVTLTSTVMPGSMDRVVVPALERSSGKRAGVDFGVCYSPEFIALGSVVRDLEKPDFYLIGESDSESGERLAQFYSQVCHNKAPSSRMNFVNAELTKISINSFITMKISFANSLASICQGLPGADVDEVSAAVGLDSRIGRKYLKGGLGYGGPCFPRDNRAVAALAKLAGTEAPLAATTDTVNKARMVELCSLMEKQVEPGQSVGILGLAYKPDTEVVEESQAVALAQRLAERGAKVVIFDPQANATAKALLPASVTVAASAEELIRSTSVMIICSAYPQFTALSSLFNQRLSEGATVIDCWRVLDRSLRKHPQYLGLGLGSRSRGIQIEMVDEDTAVAQASTNPTVSIAAMGRGEDRSTRSSQK